MFKNLGRGRCRHLPVNISVMEVFMKYKRILLKLSGGALSGDKNFGFDKDMLEHITNEIINAKKMGVEVSVLVGGGNIFRG